VQQTTFWAAFHYGTPPLKVEKSADFAHLALTLSQQAIAAATELPVLARIALELNFESSGIL